ncbi:MAG TPA: hypothetical protein VHZ03_19470 [Trebonia sp.]|nr:hypothetical protein [Trebonia sp.]
MLELAGALHGPYGWTGVTLFGASIVMLAFLLWAWTRAAGKGQAAPAERRVT